MTVVLALADIAEHPPPFGSIIRIAPRKLVVFANTGNIGCKDCAFVDDGPGCGATNCFDGVYITGDISDEEVTALNEGRNRGGEDDGEDTSQLSLRNVQEA